MKELPFSPGISFSATPVDLLISVQRTSREHLRNIEERCGFILRQEGSSCGVFGHLACFVSVLKQGQVLMEKGGEMEYL